MPFIDDLAAVAVDTFKLHSGAFYAAGEGLSPGAGIIFADVRYPIFNPDTGRYQIRIGATLVLTHECDIDPANDRDFNTEVFVGSAAFA